MRATSRSRSSDCLGCQALRERAQDLELDTGRVLQQVPKAPRGDHECVHRRGRYDACGRRGIQEQRNLSEEADIAFRRKLTTLLADFDGPFHQDEELATSV